MQPVQLDEKEYLLVRDIENMEGFTQPVNVERKKSSIGKFIKKLSLCVLSGLTILFLVGSYKGTTKCNSGFLSVLAASGLAPSMPLVEEFFEIQTPLNNEGVLNNQLLFNSSLADITGDYAAPETTFSSGFFTLNFTNTNQVSSTEPVVVEITVDDFTLWRSSAPLSKLDTITHSSTYQDFTQYLSLFKENRTISLYVLEGSAAGILVSLEVTLVESSTTDADVEEVNTALSIFDSESPASKVISITGKNVATNKVSVTLPNLESNSTNAKIALFASASKDEIAYYIDGKEPLRYLNIFVNDIYLTSISPKPNLYHTNGLSDELIGNFDPIVEYGNFAGLVYEIELISILPLLWAGETTLDISVVSPIDTTVPAFPIPKPVIKGQNEIANKEWLISGNILVWEFANVISGNGEIVDSNSNQLSSAISTPPSMNPWAPKISNLIVKDKIDANISSTFNFTMVDNTNLLFTVNTNSSTTSIVSKHSKSINNSTGSPSMGSPASKESTSLTAVNINKFSIEVLDSITNTTLLTSTRKVSFPVSINKSSSTSPIPEKKTIPDVQVSVNSEISKSFNKIITSDFKVKEHFSNSILGPLSNFKYEDGDYSRQVEVSNGTITKDTTLPVAN